MESELENWPSCQQQRKQRPQRISDPTETSEASMDFAVHQAEDCGAFYKDGEGCSIDFGNSGPL